jgi:hypothetical protein
MAPATLGIAYPLEQRGIAFAPVLAILLHLASIRRRDVSSQQQDRPCILDLYEEACDANRPVVCFDEKSVQLVAETRRP